MCLLNLVHLERCVGYSAMVNALKPDGASINTVLHATTPALMALIVLLLVRLLAVEIHPLVLPRESKIVVLVRRRLSGMPLAPHLLFAVAMARSSAGPSMSSVLNAIVSRSSWLPTAF